MLALHSSSLADPPAARFRPRCVPAPRLPRFFSERSDIHQEPLKDHRWSLRSQCASPTSSTRSKYIMVALSTWCRVTSRSPSPRRSSSSPTLLPALSLPRCTAACSMASSFTVKACAALLVAALVTPTAALPASAPAKRQTLSVLTATQISSFKPYTHYASTAYCQPATTLAWNCGANCDANPSFVPVASGGDGELTQFCEWFIPVSSRDGLISYFRVRRIRPHPERNHRRPPGHQYQGTVSITAAFVRLGGSC